MVTLTVEDRVYQIDYYLTRNGNILVLRSGDTYIVRSEGIIDAFQYDDMKSVELSEVKSWVELPGLPGILKGNHPEALTKLVAVEESIRTDVYRQDTSVPGEDLDLSLPDGWSFV